MSRGSQQGPIWLWGLLLALVLILLSTRGHVIPKDTALQQQFAPQPTVPGATPQPQPQFDLERLPPEVIQAGKELWQGLQGGERVPALTPAAQTARLRVDIYDIQRQRGTVQVRGQVTNNSSAPVQVPLSAFALRDSSGATYTATDGTTVQLAPGENTPLDLNVPLPDGRGLLLILNFPPDPLVEQVLLVPPGNQ